jgi:serine/threonine-protein kinase HipA
MSLDVHLRGERIGTLFPAGADDYRFAYAPEVVERVGAGATLLSNTLPVRPEPYSAAATRAYAEALLPEGAWRGRLARELGVDADDGYTLLAKLGRDCSGAVVFLPEGTPLRSGADAVSWLSEDELGELVTQPPPRLIDPTSAQRMRFSLAGVNHKLALLRDEVSGRWAWPESGVPSTHVVKPETGAFPDLAVNEMFCMSVIRGTGLSVAQVELETIAGQRCLVSRRFDREGEGLCATRVHQEDFCQALGFPPNPGVGDEDADGPGFLESCGVLKAVGRADEVPHILVAAVCNYVLGNGDAHGKNFALLFDEDGPGLAPMYDVTSTAVYDAPIHTGMVFAEDYDETAYLLELGRICEECDFDFEIFRKLASDTAARIGNCLEEVAERARAEGWHTPVIDSIVELASERAFGLGVEVEY